MINLSTKYCYLVLICLLTSCSFKHQSPVPATTNPAIAQVWSLKGKILITQQKKSTHAKLLWKQRHHDYQINIFGPLGQGALKLEKKGAQIQLTNAKNKIFYAHDPEQLLLQQSGLRFPINSLANWLFLKFDTPKIRAIKRDEFGHIKSFQIADWQVDIKSVIVKNNYRLAKKIFIQHLTEAVRIKLIIYQWQIDAHL